MKNSEMLLYLCKVNQNTPIKALIQLLDDPDDFIYEHVRSEIKIIGTDALPFLENSWESDDFGLLFQNRIEQIIHEIQFEHCKNELQNWKSSEDKDLLKAAIIIAKYQYPNLDESNVISEIEKIKKDIWLEINPNMTAFEKIKTFNKVFYEMYRFHGNSKSFHSPLNSFINTVLETRKGNPLTLSIIYSIIAQDLEIPVYGVNLPNQFILCYLDKNSTYMMLEQKSKYGVLFYINTFSKGRIFYENDIIQFLQQLKTTPERAHFEPCSNTVIIHRMILNLISSFQQVGNKEKVDELIELSKILY